MKSEKQKDIVKIGEFIEKQKTNAISVTDVRQFSGADPLRVDSILFEMAFRDEIIPTKRDCWGSLTEFKYPYRNENKIDN